MSDSKYRYTAGIDSGVEVQGYGMTDTNDGIAISNEDVMRMTTDIVASFLSNNSIASESVPNVIREVHKVVHSLAIAPNSNAALQQKPAVPVSRSISDGYIVCLEDGKKLKMLKRYLRTNFDMTPDDYRKKWGLPADYPMVAPGYAKQRSALAKKIGLGRGGRSKKKNSK